MEENENPQAEWNLSGSTIRLISAIREKASEYALGLQPKSNMDEIVLPNHKKAFECWDYIALLITNRLNPKQRKHLNYLKNKLEKDSVKLNPNYQDGKDYKEEEPKYLYLTNEAYGIESQRFIKFVDYLIKKIGMGIADTDPDIGYM